MLLLAAGVAVLHAATVVFVVTGSVLALRWPRLLGAHAAVALAVLIVHLAGQPCPLTVLELWLRAQAGVPPYDGGFLGHYITEPLGYPIETMAAQLGVYLTAIVPNVVSYSLHAARALSARRARV